MWSTGFWVIGWALAFFLSYTIVRERRSPTSTTAWLILVFAFPFIGAFIYLLIGTRKRSTQRRRLRSPKGFVGAALSPHAGSSIEDFVSRLGMLPSSLNDVQVHVEAGAARRALLEVINSAEREIFVLIYDFSADKSGQEIMAALTAASDRGVKVRVLVDDVGSWAQHQVKSVSLRSRTIAIHRFKPMLTALFLRTANLRNHRKIVVADSARAWSGGRNIGDAYLADHAEQSRWADLSMTITGPGAAVLDEVCRTDWLFVTGESLAIVQTEPSSPQMRCRTQILVSGPDQRDDHWHAVLLKSLMSTKSRIWIASPYFIPDEALLQALLVAARSGVDVRILVPQRSDSKLVDLVANSYMSELMRFGATVMRYNAGMMHAKVLIVDETVILGSGNFDARSFFLNYELSLLCYDNAILTAVSSYFEFLSARATKGLRSRPAWREALAGCARVLAPML